MIYGKMTSEQLICAYNSVKIIDLYAKVAGFDERNGNYYELLR